MNFLIAILITVMGIFSDRIINVNCGSYTDATGLSDTLLASTRYRKDVRPVLDQLYPINITVSFMIVSIVEVNDVSQSFQANGFLALNWIDERLTWNMSDHGGTFAIHPHPKDIWRPRMILLNTLDKRDIFEDDACPVTILHNGSVSWVPGGLFKTSCNMNLLKYPFDEQACIIGMLPMSFEYDELIFNVGATRTTFYTPNGEWNLKQITISTEIVTVDSATFSGFEVTFFIARRPTFFVLNILLPVVLLSLLNMLVFTIPADSGEKISYGITVVLALSVFLSTVSGMLPSSSDVVPLVTIYLFILLVVSVLTVIVAIIIVFLSNREEKTERRIKITRQYSHAASKIGAMKKAFRSLLTTTKISPPSSENDRKTPTALGISYNSKDDEKREEKQGLPDKEKGNSATGEEDGLVNRYKLIGRYIDCVSLIIFSTIWFVVTMWYFISVRS